MVRSLNVILYPFMWLAAAGLVVALAYHIAALIGLRLGEDRLFWATSVGVFVVFVPPMVLMQFDASRVPLRPQDWWNFALRGCPNWMRWIVYGFTGYAVVNFLWFLLWGAPVRPTNPATAGELRGITGHLMAFYSAAYAMLYSRIAAGPPRTRRCPHGHEVSALAKYCEECGRGVPDRLT